MTNITMLQAPTSVHRRQAHAALSDSLAVIYPVVVKLIDEPFFRQTARQYLLAYPAFKGDLRGFGRHYPEFLAQFRALRAIPYVADVARLEWAHHWVQHAPEDRRRIDLDRLVRVGDAERPRLRFRLHPAAAPVASRFPILHVWQAYQDDATQVGDIDLYGGGTQLLVVRNPGFDVEFRHILPGEYALLQALAADRALHDARREAMLVDPDFDAVGALSRFIQQDILISFRPDSLDNA